MCQSSGCLAIVSPKKSATSCIIATRPSLPWRVGISSPMMIAIPRSLNWQTAGSRAAPVRRATIAGPAGMVIALPSPQHRDTRSGEIPIRQKANHALAMDRVDESGKYVGVALGEYLHAETFAKGEEGGELVSRQLLDDRRDGHAGHTGPGAGQIPVPAVRQGDDSARSRVRLPYQSPH